MTLIMTATVTVFSRFPSPFGMDQNVVVYGLALLGSVWYFAMWSVSILGCVAA